VSEVISKRLAEIRARYEQRVDGPAREWKSREDAVAAIGVTGMSVWEMVEPARTALMLADAVEAAVSQTSNGIGSASYVGGYENALDDVREAVAAALSQDAEETR
jgi:hypothetical protein